MPLPLAGALVAAVLFNIVRQIVSRLVVFLVSKAGAIITALASGASFVEIFSPGFLQEWWDSSGTKEFFIEKFNSWIVAYAKEKLDLDLDAADPLGKTSVNNAISAKLGITLHDITSREQTLTDLGAHLAQQVNLRLGTNFENFWPIENVQAQMENEVYVAVSSALSGATTFLSDSKVSTIRSLLRQTDGVFVMRTTKSDRAALLNRARQAKYRRTHKRMNGPWVPK
jgi:hypothetical protein